MMVQPKHDIAALLIDECRRRLLQESIPRIRKCLEQLSEEEIWLRPNAELVSVGNLVLHLCGNVRQWLVSALGGKPDERQRDAEFSEKGPLPTSRLLDMLRTLEREITETLNRLDKDDLTRDYVVQGFEESGVSILVHVMEHFSYHVGQIAYFTKLRKETQLHFYRGLDLSKKNR